MLEVPVDGVPDPEMVWKYADGSDVVTADNVKVKYAGNVAKIMFIPGKRKERMHKCLVLLPLFYLPISKQHLSLHMQVVIRVNTVWPPRTSGVKTPPSSS